MGLRKLWYVTSVFFLVFTFVLSLWFDLQTFVAYRSSQGLILTHVAVTIAITQLGRESVYCLLKLVCLILTHVAVTIAVTQLRRESVYCLLQSVCLILTHIAIRIAVTQLGRESVCCMSQLRSQLRNWEERVFVACRS
jgi:hypothetical protein